MVLIKRFINSHWSEINRKIKIAVGFIKVINCIFYRKLIKNQRYSMFLRQSISISNFLKLLNKLYRMN